MQLIDTPFKKSISAVFPYVRKIIFNSVTASVYSISSASLTQDLIIKSQIKV